MKILIIGEYYRPLIGWFQKDEPPTGTPAIYNLYQYLGNSTEHSFYSVIYNFDANRIKKMPNGSIIELKKLSFPIYLIWKLLSYFQLYRFLNRHLKSTKYDLLYGLSTYSSIAASLGQKHNILSAGRIYGTILTEKLKNKRWFKIYTRHIFELFAIKNPADCMVATQDGTAFDKVARYFNPEVDVKMMFNGMDRDYRQQLLSLEPVTKIDTSKTIRMCSISRIEHYKRHHLNIAIAKVLRDKYKLDIHLTILGTGSMLSEIRTLITQTKAHDYVVLRPEIPHADLPDLVATFDLSMFLYEGGSLGNVMWEHGLAGRVICTVDNGETCSVFQDQQNALVVADTESIVADMAAKINTYLQAERLDLGQEARKSVEKIIGTWEERFRKEFNWLESHLPSKGR